MKKHLLEDRLHFHHFNGESAWTTIYLVDDSDDERQYINCVLVDKELIENSFKLLGWEQFYIDFIPKFRFDHGTPKYYRYGTENHLKPIIIERFYSDIYPKEIEISEEFRHFFNIYTNGYKEGTLMKIDESGYDTEIVKFKKNHVQVKTEFLKEYAAAQGLQILIIFEYFRFFNESLEELGVRPFDIYEATDKQLNFQIDFQVDRFTDSYKSNARLLGKKWLKELKNYTPESLYDTINKEDYEEFIIRLDDKGKPIYRSCNAEHNDLDPDARFLNPVFFKREVLRKYYENPKHYEVLDRTIHKIGGWHLRLDNNHKDYVVVFLGDLGRALPHKEQIYWKSHNITPMGYLSNSYYQNSIEGKFSSPELSEFLFKNNYKEINNVWWMKFGFPLFIELHKDDEFHLQTIRIPLSDSINEFDNQALSLTKLVVDSINEAEICKYLGPKYNELKNKFTAMSPPKTVRGLDKLSLFLEEIGYHRSSEMIQLMKNIQGLRSTGVAHRKGSDYQKSMDKLRISDKNYIDAFDEILSKLNSYIEELIELYKMRFEFVNYK